MTNSGRKRFWNTLSPLLGVVCSLFILLLVLYPVARYAALARGWAKFVLGIYPMLAVMWPMLWGFYLSRHRRRLILGGTSPPFGFFVFLYVLSTYVFLMFVFSYTYIAAGKLGGQILQKTEEKGPDGKTTYTSIEPIKRTRDFLYFSTITGSTLTYGDLTPIGIARFLAALEVSAFWLFVVLRTIALREEKVLA